MPRGRRRARHIVNPGGVSYPTRRQAKRVARIGGGKVEGHSPIPALLVALAILAIVAYVWFAS